MDEKDFQREIAERTARIEGKVDMLAEMLPRVNSAERDIARIDAGQKSAHHRIDGIYKTVGLIATVVSILISLIANFGR